MSKTCALFDEICQEDLWMAGGKAANLGEMVQADFNIPPGFVICSTAFREMLQSSGLDRKISEMMVDLDGNNPSQLQKIEKKARQLIETIPISEELRQMIVESYRCIGDNVPVAVRSSATTEDLPGASFAGQQDTFLNVVGEEEVLKAFRRCCSSLYTSRAIFYRHQKGFDSSDVSMAVVVQKMICPEKSGVMFTADPVMQNRSNAVIEAVWGLGEAIVSGEVTPDHCKVNRETYEIVYEFIAQKQKMVIYCENGGVETIDVPVDQVSVPILTSKELKQLVDLGNKIENHFKCPQDVEWGIEDGTLYVLQSRPITNL